MSFTQMLQPASGRPPSRRASTPPSPTPRSPLRATLDSLHGNCFIADMSLTLVYMNRSARSTVTELSGAVRSAFGMSIEQLLGGSIHRFHKDPARIDRILADPAQLPREAIFGFGGKTLRTMINGITDDAGQRVGFVVLWDDVTGRNDAANAAFADVQGATGPHRADRRAPARRGRRDQRPGRQRRGRHRGDARRGRLHLAVLGPRQLPGPRHHDRHRRGRPADGGPAALQPGDRRLPAAHHHRGRPDQAPRPQRHHRGRPRRATPAAGSRSSPRRSSSSPARRRRRSATSSPASTRSRAPRRRPWPRCRGSPRSSTASTSRRTPWPPPSSSSPPSPRRSPPPSPTSPPARGRPSSRPSCCPEASASVSSETGVLHEIILKA